MAMTVRMALLTKVNNGASTTGMLKGMKTALPVIRGVLEKSALLEGVAADVVRDLASQSSLVRVKRGQAIVCRGERVANVYTVAFGAVKARLAPVHREMVFSLLGPGASFGKTAVLLGEPSSVDLVAVEDTLLVATRASCVTALMERNLRFAKNLVHALAERNLKLVAELDARRLSGAQRLAAYLDSIARPDGHTAHLPVSKTLLAARLGMKKETLSRVLSDLARQGLIEVRGRDIAIRDAARLREFAETA
jgi:CRP-like cAMP-binding protein